MGTAIGSKKGWIVTFAGLGVNLALGVLYSWGAFANELRALGWTATQSQIPYMVACALFALLMVPGGRLQDRMGPKKIILASAILTGIGFVLSGLFLSVVGLSIFFGVVFGSAMGFGYAAATPAALKWFGPHKRGLIAGIVVSGFGLAGIYVAPLTQVLLARFGIEMTMIVLGLGFCAAIFTFAQFISNPPEDYVPAPPVDKFKAIKVIKKNKSSGLDFDWKQVVRTPQFYGLWIMFCFGTFAGLMIIGQLRDIGLEQAALSDGAAFALISVYAVFNCLGRVGCGVISDKLDRRMTLVIIFLIQVVCFAFFAQFQTALTLFTGTAFVAFAFGGMLSLFPALTADYFGLKNLGVNYGLVFTAWGAGGVFGPLIGGIVRDMTGTYGIAFAISAGLSVLGVLLAVLTKAPEKETAAKQVPAGVLLCPHCEQEISLRLRAISS
ncbi:L-lactate MFS transporter [Dethiobacter alkaliphilus]|uniref:L-lactate MFS transporter n=1 Tax=Dethiobacter alkaliphilus TaxID=427926 RepID=UPI002227460B|nr:OFA family MFS transporter [Dethiobacter alkaliphilus]MCW3491385.1 OFA family MFS transporter [Dethiobacter alkaliphilus]